MKGLTFRKEKPPAGLASVSWRKRTTISIGGAQVGGIFLTDAREWRINITRKDERAKCGWSWARLRHKFESEPDARAWFEANADRLNGRFTLFRLEE